ncbi:hypothetical protein LJR175_007375 [Variovorax sp. LjRoot175]|uniref:hypothetical protein n=1 Tax=Variovorax sp. LjRoot175 TaxID=3342276 RepID=UPI003ECE08C9
MHRSARPEGDPRDAEVHYAVQEKCTLADVDRARKATRQLEGEWAREQQSRRRGAEAAAQLLDAKRQALRDAQETAQQTNADCAISSQARAPSSTAQSGALAMPQAGSEAVRANDDEHAEQDREGGDQAPDLPVPSPRIWSTPALMGKPTPRP